jgi:hypothetical protein
MQFAHILAALLASASAASALPNPQDTNKPSPTFLPFPRECCCCNPGIPAIVCKTVTTDQGCVCPAVVCPPKTPKMKQCCCCDKCGLIPFDESCICPAVVCPTKAVI